MTPPVSYANVSKSPRRVRVCDERNKYAWNLWPGVMGLSHDVQRQQNTALLPVNLFRWPSSLPESKDDKRALLQLERQPVVSGALCQAAE